MTSPAHQPTPLPLGKYGAPTMQCWAQAAENVRAQQAGRPPRVVVAPK